MLDIITADFLTKPKEKEKMATDCLKYIEQEFPRLYANKNRLEPPTELKKLIHYSPKSDIINNNQTFINKLSSEASENSSVNLSVQNNLHRRHSSPFFNRELNNNISSPEKYVGYADLPNQIHRYCTINGFDFNIMIIGESGLGKSTFINNIFSSDIYVQTKYSEKTPPIVYQTMDIRHSTVTLTENAVPLRLTVIDTPGFGDCINNSTCFEKIVSFINKRYEEYMKWENSTQRTPIRDNRVHCLIYFISPTGHQLKSIDVDLLKRLHERVNIIPVIGRADTLTSEDLTQFKKRIIDDLKINGIRIYDFPEISFRQYEDKETIMSYATKAPFAIVSSNHIIESNGKQVRCRKYPWGICEIENLHHSDFIPLRDLLLRTCTCHLIETTHLNFYERYRCLSLSEVSGVSNDNNEISPLEVIESERKKQAARLEQAKKDLELSYQQRQDDYKKKLEEKEKFHSSKLNQEETEINKLKSDGGSSNTEAQSSPMPNVNRTDEKDKKKDKKKRLF